jgi:hypothetical protein
MASTVVVDRIEVRKELGNLLMLRSTVAPLFRTINQSAAARVIVDFSGVDFMSRSFADEYLAEKAASKKRIQERKVPTEVRRMMEMVSSRLASTHGPSSQVLASYHRGRVSSL